MLSVLHFLLLKDIIEYQIYEVSFMKKVFLSFVFVSVFAFSNLIEANLKYNPYTGKYEAATKDSKLKYNPYSGQYSYSQPSSKLKYNPYSGQYSYQKPSAKLKYNPYTGKYYYEK